MKKMAIIHEINAVKKDLSKVDLKFALVYPNAYRVGMSNFAIQQIYHLLNSREDVACERFFLDSYRTIESNQPLKKFDVIGFSIHYELDYFNVIHILTRSQIQVGRQNNRPLIIVGGPCASENPLPLSTIADAFVIGEIEPILNQLVDALKNASPNNLDSLKEVEGVWVPEEGRYPIKIIHAENLDKMIHTSSQIITKTNESSLKPIFGESILLEVMKGCPYRCRFCLIKRIMHPHRCRTLNSLAKILHESIRRTPSKKVTLIGATPTSHNKLLDLYETILGLGITEVSVPSLRADRITEELAKLIVKARQKTITLAPETGSQELRDSIAKDLTNQQIIDAVKIASSSGIKAIKLYFIVGLPGENMEDINLTVELIREVRRKVGGKCRIKVSVTPFVPKPHTPFQWLNFPDIKELSSKIKILRGKIQKIPGTTFSSVNPKWSRIEAILSLGDEKISQILMKATSYGGGLGAWRRAEGELKINCQTYLDRKDLEWNPPWSFINTGFSTGGLRRELQKALQF